MPTAEDIGYLIEVEVSPIDDTPQDIAIAQYGPLEMDKDDKAKKLLEEVMAFKEKFHMELNKVNLMTIIKVPVVEPQL